jgi:hypothetical protein
MKLRIPSAVMFATCLVLGLACQPATETDPVKRAHDSINANDIMAHTKELSSDKYEGRGPGTPARS